MIKKIYLYAMCIPTLLLAAPTNPSVLQLNALSETSVSINWTDNSTDETGFKIYRDDILIQTTDEDITTFTDTNLTANTTYTYNIKATDDIQDIVVPEVTLNGASIMGINMGSSYTEQGATATDNVDGDITADIIITGEVDTSYAGLYILTYTVTDMAGNSASVTRRISVYSDNIGDTMIVDPSRNYVYVNLHDDTPSGAYYSFDDDDFVNAGEKVLTLHSSGLNNSFHILGYETDIKYNWASFLSHQDRHLVSWDGKFSEDFIIFIVLKFKTAEGETLWSDLVYTPTLNGYANYTDNFMHISLGESAKNGSWQHYERDILDDLHQFYPGATIDYDANWSSYVNGFAVRGSGSITNVKLGKN